MAGSGALGVVIICLSSCVATIRSIGFLNRVDVLSSFWPLFYFTISHSLTAPTFRRSHEWPICSAEVEIYLVQFAQRYTHCLRSMNDRRDSSQICYTPQFHPVEVCIVHQLLRLLPTVSSHQRTERGLLSISSPWRRWSRGKLRMLHALVRENFFQHDGNRGRAKDFGALRELE